MEQGVGILHAHFIELLEFVQSLMNFGVSLGAEKVGKHFTFFWGGPVLSLNIIHTSI